MSANDNGGHAFPTTAYYDEKPYGVNEGMSLRDYFAAKAMVGLLSAARLVEEGEPKYERLATLSYNCADAMLDARTPKAGQS
jgi:hypothetical protein